MLSSLTNFRAKELPSGLRLTNPEGRRIDVNIKDDGITLQGDAFAHSIRVEGDQIHISSLEGDGPDVTFPKLVYLEDSRRIALGVAASLTGLPVNLFIDEIPEPVYANLANRRGMGRRRNGSREGGRYRVTKMERQANGQFDIHLKDGHVRKGPNEYHAQPTLYLKSRSGWPLELNGAFRKMTGTSFGEAFQSNVSEFWRNAGKPGDAAQAAGVSHFIFDLSYKQEPGYEVYRPTKDHAELTQALVDRHPDYGYTSPDRDKETWDLLSQAALKGYDAKRLLKTLKA
jgi:PAS domain-containing protein